MFVLNTNTQKKPTVTSTFFQAKLPSACWHCAEVGLLPTFLGIKLPASSGLMMITDAVRQYGPLKHQQHTNLYTVTAPYSRFSINN
jgi:hypothetical protein